MNKTLSYAGKKYHALYTSKFPTWGEEGDGTVEHSVEKYTF